jgi:CRISPR/Cas system CMR-associated protein Cmr1 (group 7 of RAMP superfamily)
VPQPSSIRPWAGKGLVVVLSKPRTIPARERTRPAASLLLLSASYLSEKQSLTFSILKIKKISLINEVRQNASKGIFFYAETGL